MHNVHITQLTFLQGLLDLSKATVAGHSFGGCTALKTLAQDKRFKYVYSFKMFRIIYEYTKEMGFAHKNHSCCEEIILCVQSLSKTLQTLLISSLLQYVYLEGTLS